MDEYLRIQEILKEALARIKSLRYTGYGKAAILDLEYTLANQQRMAEETTIEVLCPGEPYVPEEKNDD
jgi:hypothetical protein